jgi:hypothetical protein
MNPCCDIRSTEFGYARKLELHVGRVALTSLASVLVSASSLAQPISAVVAHPPFKSPFKCSEHAKGELTGLGDELGQDCVVESFVEDEGRLWTRPYKTNGRENEDWFGWNQHILSPCACKVTQIQRNPITNKPGIVGKSPASLMILRRDDGVHFLLAHIQNELVKVGDAVTYGQPVAKVGNNGFSRIPHVHIGAWKGQTPLQIRWDLTKKFIP